MALEFSRRHLLSAGSGLALAGFAAPAFATARADGLRALTFDCLHTGEKLNVEYWAGGQYVPEALSAINHVLRDFRTGETHMIAPRLLDLLHTLHTTLGSGRAFQVISGYRSPATNARLHEKSAGVATHSLHMKGMAIDIRLADRALDSLRNAAFSLRAGGVGYYPQSDFVHVDVGNVRHW
jgi:uncharacterized protein YcbK (DUF882 family)